MIDHAGAVAQINQLHAQVVEQAATSRKCLHAALVAAWKAGQLLVLERKHVRKTMGAMWGEWLKQNFRGCRATAQKYIRLAEVITDEHELEGLSLRQMYLRLGIATEPKARTESGTVAPFPPHVRLANRLLAVLKSSTDFRDASSYSAYRQDLRGLYLRLRPHFENDCEPDKTSLALSSPVHKIAP